MLQHRAVDLAEDVGPHFDDEVGPHAEDVPIESGMVQSAQREAVRDDRFSARVAIGENVRGFEELDLFQTTDGTAILIGPKHAFAEGLLVNALQRESRHVAAASFGQGIGQARRRGAELAIVLRGDLAAILRFAAGKKNPDFLSEAEVLDGLLSQASMVAARNNARLWRNEAQNVNGTPSGAPSLVSQESVVAGAGFEPPTFRL